MTMYFPIGLLNPDGYLIPHYIRLSHNSQIAKANSHDPQTVERMCHDCRTLIRRWVPDDGTTPTAESGHLAPENTLDC